MKTSLRNDFGAREPNGILEDAVRGGHVRGQTPDVPLLAAAAFLVAAGEAVPARLRPDHLRAAARAGRLLVGVGEPAGVGAGLAAYSHSIVAGGLDERSRATRFTAGISLMMRLEIVSRRS